MAENGRLRVGLFGVGLEAYWGKFAGLEDRLKGYLARVAAKMERPGREVLNFGLVDSAGRAQAVAHETRRQNVDLLVTLRYDVCALVHRAPHSQTSARACAGPQFTARACD